MPETLRNGDQPSRKEKRRLYDLKRDRSREARGWYNRAIWRKKIRPEQLAREPLCKYCLEQGIITPATVVNHVGGHQDDYERFIAGPFESTCDNHHNSHVQRVENAARREATGKTNHGKMARFFAPRPTSGGEE